MSEKQHYKTLIIGGGIAGLTTAIALKRKGISAKIVEATPQLKPVGAGLSLAANAMKALRHIGIAEAVIRHGRQLNSFSLYNDAGKLLKKGHTDPLHSIHGISNFTIHRADLHATLLSFIDLNDLITAKRTTGFLKTSKGYEIQFEDGTVISCGQLIIAEGINSPLRQQLLPSSAIRFAGYTCWRGIATTDSVNGFETSETWGKKGRFGIVPLSGNTIYWFACINTPDRGSLKNYTLSDLQHHFSDFHQNVQHVLANTPAENVIWGDISDLAPIHQYAFDNALLIGDAAHATTPNMGQGACMAIEDAVILAECMASRQDFNEAIKHFEQLRLKRTHSVVNQSWKLGKIAQLENGLLIALRNTAFRLLPQKKYQQQLESLYEIEFTV